MKFTEPLEIVLKTLSLRFPFCRFKMEWFRFIEEKTENILYSAKFAYTAKKVQTAMKHTHMGTCLFMGGLFILSLPFASSATIHRMNSIKSHIASVEWKFVSL